MPLRGLRPLTLAEMQRGQLTWMTEEAAKELSPVYGWLTLGVKDYTLPHGYYYIDKILQPVKDPDPSNPTLPVAEVEIRQVNWPNTQPSLLLVYNCNNELLGGSAILLSRSSPIYPVAQDVKGLDRLNEGRTHCMLCTRPLNVCSVNLRICASCEKRLEEQKND